MATRSPLVLNAGQIQQLQSGDDVDIPANQRIDELEQKLNAIIAVMVDAGFEIPDELTDNL